MTFEDEQVMQQRIKVQKKKAPSKAQKKVEEKQEEKPQHDPKEKRLNSDLDLIHSTYLQPQTFPSESKRVADTRFVPVEVNRLRSAKVSKTVSFIQQPTRPSVCSRT